MAILSANFRFRSSEAAQTRHTCHNGPVWGRELWQVCLACARYQTSFSLSLTKYSALAPPLTPGLLNSIPPRAQDTLATHPRSLAETQTRTNTTPRPGPARTPVLLACPADRRERSSKPISRPVPAITQSYNKRWPCSLTPLSAT
jgi:hypothetical protein